MRAQGALEGTVAFVSNGAVGVGSGLTASLLADGAAVAVGHHGRHGDITEFLEACDSEKVSAHEGTMGSWEDSRRAIEEAVARHGSLDALITVVGPSRQGPAASSQPLLAMSSLEWQRRVVPMVSGVFNLTRAAVDYMAPKGAGRVINIIVLPTSVGGAHSSSHWLREAVIGLTRQFAREAASHGVTVNAVSPGLVDEPELDVFPGLREEAIALVPTGRLGVANDVARVVRFLLSSESDYVTGQILDVDGGLRT